MDFPQNIIKEAAQAKCCNLCQHAEMEDIQMLTVSRSGQPSRFREWVEILPGLYPKENNNKKSKRGKKRKENHPSPLGYRKIPFIYAMLVMCLQHLEKQNGNQYFIISSTYINDGTSKIYLSLQEGCDCLCCYIKCFSWSIQHEL